MSGNLWMFSDKLDDEDIEIMKHEFITYYQGADYYGLGLKMFTRLAHEAGAVYKIGKKVLIRRTIFDEYLRQQYHIEQMASLAADGKEASTRQGTLVLDTDSGRMNIRFGLNDYYGFLSCGTRMEVRVDGEWIPTRLEIHDRRGFHLCGRGANPHQWPVDDCVSCNRCRSDPDPHSGNRSGLELLQAPAGNCRTVHRCSRFSPNSYVRDAVVEGGSRMGFNGGAGFVGRAFGGIAARNGATLNGNSISSVAARAPSTSGTIAGDIADRSLGNYMPQMQGFQLQGTQITGGHISTTAVSADGKSASVDMFNASQFEKPEVPHSVVTAADGSQWYQMASGEGRGAFYDVPTFHGVGADIPNTAAGDGVSGASQPGESGQSFGETLTHDGVEGHPGMVTYPGAADGIGAADILAFLFIPVYQANPLCRPFPRRTVSCTRESDSGRVQQHRPDRRRTGRLRFLPFPERHPLPGYSGHARRSEPWSASEPVSQQPLVRNHRQLRHPAYARLYG